jgi:hypothetical protein
MAAPMPEGIAETVNTTIGVWIFGIFCSDLLCLDFEQFFKAGRIRKKKWLELPGTSCFQALAFEKCFFYYTWWMRLGRRIDDSRRIRNGIDEGDKFGVVCLEFGHRIKD